MQTIDPMQLPLQVREQWRGVPISKCRVRGPGKNNPTEVYYVTHRMSNVTYVYEYQNGRWVETKSY